ncbi:MAG: sulfatase-like hydrolase/transferase [bacterium]|nr:sulfatase-like hydrolase/transferase [bacterium]
MPKNIVMIMTDQMHKYAMGCVTPYVKTPNLDRLAREGTLFTNAYSNNPVCGPFRGILFSGCYSKECGIQDNNHALRADEVTLPLEMEALGYDTSFVGKLHLGGNGNLPIPEECRAGHRHFIGYQCYNGFLDNVCFYDEEGREHIYQEHRTDVTARLGIERMRELAKAGKPFLHTIFFQAPHYPEQPSEPYEHWYDGFSFPMPELFQPIEPYTPTYSPYSPRPFEKCPDYRRYGGNIQLYLKLYYAMVSQIDENVGKILDEVERLGIAEDTAILFSSDHGDMQGSHGLKNKCLPFERSCGIPLIVKVPWMKQVPIVETPVSAVDYYPTCMEIAGGVSKKKLAGESLLGLLQGKTKSHAPIFAENHLLEYQWYMLRDERYKLTIDAKTKKANSLYDMQEDPIEAINLVEKPAFQGIKEQLYQKLLAEVGDYQYQREIQF